MAPALLQKKIRNSTAVTEGAALLERGRDKARRVHNRDCSRMIHPSEQPCLSF